jgi:hypothetical protein
MDEDRSGLQSLVGEQLSAVTFVADYVQLAFDGAGLTALTAVRVIMRDGTRLIVPEPGSRDALCAVIGAEVRAASANVARIRVDFSDGRAVEIPVDDASYVSAEAAQFHHRDGTRVVG